MAATVGALQVDLQANTASFIADMGKAAHAISSNTAQMKIALDGVARSFEFVKGAAVALGAGILVDKVIEFTKESAHAKAELASLSVQLGVSTDALQGYRYQAATTGLAQAELDSGINHLSKTIGEAARGNTDAIETFRELGVGILDARGKVRSTEDILLDVATAISKVEDSSKRTRLEMALLGRDGARFGALFANGGAGLAEFTEKARAAGAIVDVSVIHTLDEAQNRAAQFQQKMQAAAANVAAYLIEMSEDGRQALQALYDKMRVRALVPDNTVYNGPVPPAPLPLPPTARPAVPPGFSLPESDADKRRNYDVRKRVEDINLEAESLGRLKSEILKVQLARELDVEASVRQGHDKRRFDDPQVDAIVAAQQRLEAKQSLEEDIARDRERRDATLAFTQDQQRLTAQLLEQAKAAEASHVVWDDVAKSYRVSADELAIVAKQQEILNQRLDITAEDARKMGEEYVAATDKLRSANAGAERDLRRTNAAISEMDGFAERTFDHIGQAMATAYATGETAADRFRAVALSIGSEIELEFFKLAAINPLKNWLFGSNSPTLDDVGGLLGKLGGRNKSSTGVAAGNQPEELGLTLPGADEGSENIVTALGDQTATQGDFFKTLGSGITSGLDGLGGFLNQGLMLIVTAIESLVGASAAGGAGGGAGGLLGMLGLAGAGGGGGAELLGGGEGVGGSVLEDLAVTGFATGTNNAPGGPAIVGEDGPELVNLPQGAQVLPNDATQQAFSAGAGTTINADLRGASVDAVQRLERFVMAINASLERRAVAANVDAMRRGGPIRSAYSAA